MARINGAADLIALSQSEDRFVTAPWSWEVGNDLIGLADDYVETNDSQHTLECWGEDDCGEWRVHLTQYVSDSDIEDLQSEAELAGDSAQVELCQRALVGGEASAIDACVAAIQASRAMSD